MRKRHPSILLAMSLLLVWSGSAWAAGFNIYEAGARATALGGAFSPPRLTTDRRCSTTRQACRSSAASPPT